jgi:hypothetical protein
MRANIAERWRADDGQIWIFPALAVPVLAAYQILMFPKK